MKDRIKATIAALATMGLLAAIFALPALAQSGVDEAWTNEMNQTSYWEARFGAECTKHENHSGTIGAGYTQVVVKDGTRVRVYDPAPSPFTALGPVNPANGKHHEAPHSWVIKCTKSSTSSTTTSSTSSTTSTTSTSLATTTTLGTTSTSIGTTTTSTPESGTSSTLPQTSTTTPSTLPFTGFDGGLVVVLFAGLGLVGGLILYLTKTQP